MYVEDINITDLNELAESKDSIKRYICLHLERGDVFPLKENIVNLTPSEYSRCTNIFKHVNIFFMKRQRKTKFLLKVISDADPWFRKEG